MRDLLFNEIVVYEKKLDLSTALSKAQEYVQTFKDDDAAAKELTFLQSRVGNQAAAGDASEADTSMKVQRRNQQILAQTNLPRRVIKLCSFMNLRKPRRG